jgi:hypothetical protein
MRECSEISPEHAATSLWWAKRDARMKRLRFGSGACGEEDVGTPVGLDRFDPRHPDPLGNAHRGFVLCIDGSNDPWRAEMP